MDEELTVQEALAHFKEGSAVLVEGGDGVVDRRPYCRQSVVDGVDARKVVVVVETQFGSYLRPSFGSDHQLPFGRVEFPLNNTEEGLVAVAIQWARVGFDAQHPHLDVFLSTFTVLFEVPEHRRVPTEEEWSNWTQMLAAESSKCTKLHVTDADAAMCAKQAYVNAVVENHREIMLQHYAGNFRTELDSNQFSKAHQQLLRTPPGAVRLEMTGNLEAAVLAYCHRWLDAGESDESDLDYLERLISKYTRGTRAAPLADRIAEARRLLRPPTDDLLEDVSDGT